MRAYRVNSNRKWEQKEKRCSKRVLRKTRIVSPQTQTQDIRLSPQARHLTSALPLQPHKITLLEQKTPLASLPDRWFQRSHNRLVEHVFQALLRQRRALYILDGTELSCETFACLVPDRALLLLRELFDNSMVVAQIHLGADNETRDTGAVVVDLREPLLLDIFVRGGRRDAEADEKDVCLRIREWAKTIVILLTGSIKQAQSVRFVANHYRHCVIVENSGNIFRGEFVGGVGDQETGLSNGTITNNDALYCLHDDSIKRLVMIREY